VFTSYTAVALTLHWVWRVVKRESEGEERGRGWGRGKGRKVGRRVKVLA
jgi:hypothetical protein